MGPWQLLAIAFAAQGAISFVELGVPVLAPYIKDGFGLSAFAVGIVVTSLNVGRFIGSVPAGQVADRIGERLVLVASGLGLTVFAALAAGAGYGLLLLALALAGIFSGAATPAGSKLVLVAFPRERRGLPMGIRQAAIPLGALAASIALPLMADAWGWRLTLAIAAAIPLVGTAAAIAARTPTNVPTSAAARRGTLAEIARNRKITYAGIWALLFVGGQYALLTYLALYLEDDLGFSRTAAFTLLAVSNASGFVGRLAWGWLSDRFFDSRRRPGLIAVTVAGVLSAALLGAAPVHGAIVMASAGAALGGFCLIGWQGLWVTMVSELAPEGSSATAVGFALLFTNAGIVIWPPLLGLTADLTGSFRWSWVLLGTALLLSLWPLDAIRRVGPREAWVREDGTPGELSES
ncbi:MFS transporter [Baekduia soli]|nr:MFS transporter [Baekduia soli]